MRPSNKIPAGAQAAKKAIVKFEKLLYNNKAVCLGVRTGGSCAMGGCEPCQAGNRAALSGFAYAPQ